MNKAVIYSIYFVLILISNQCIGGSYSCADFFSRMEGVWEAVSFENYPREGYKFTSEDVKDMNLVEKIDPATGSIFWKTNINPRTLVSFPDGLFVKKIYPDIIFLNLFYGNIVKDIGLSNLSDPRLQIVADPSLFCYSPNLNALLGFYLLPAKGFPEPDYDKNNFLVYKYENDAMGSCNDINKGRLSQAFWFDGNFLYQNLIPDSIVKKSIKRNISEGDLNRIVEFNLDLDKYIYEWAANRNSPNAIEGFTDSKSAIDAYAKSSEIMQSWMDHMQGDVLYIPEDSQGLSFKCRTQKTLTAYTNYFIFDSYHVTSKDTVLRKFFKDLEFNSARFAGTSMGRMILETNKEYEECVIPIMSFSFFSYKALIKDKSNFFQLTKTNYAFRKIPSGEIIPYFNTDRYDSITFTENEIFWVKIRLPVFPRVNLEKDKNGLKYPQSRYTSSELPDYISLKWVRTADGIEEYERHIDDAGKETWILKAKFIKQANAE